MLERKQKNLRKILLKIIKWGKISVAHDLVFLITKEMKHGKKKLCNDVFNDRKDDFQRAIHGWTEK